MYILVYPYDKLNHWQTKNLKSEVYILFNWFLSLNWFSRTIFSSYGNHQFVHTKQFRAISTTSQNEKR